MSIKKTSFYILIFSLFFSACSSTKTTVVELPTNFENKPNQEQQTHLKKHKFIDDVTYSNYMSKRDNSINKELLSFYNEWKGVKYRLGGTTKKGIDCSAFVQKALLEKFDLKLPRDTRSQVNIGKTIKKSDLQMGDLVFFKTGRTNHVGIYLENGKFMHASTKIGVTISKMDNVYFKTRFWQAKRVLN